MGIKKGCLPVVGKHPLLGIEILLMNFNATVYLRFFFRLTLWKIDGKNTVVYSGTNLIFLYIIG